MFRNFARPQYEKELADFVKDRETELRPIESFLKTSFETVAQNKIHLTRDGDTIANFLSTQKS